MCVTTAPTTTTAVQVHFQFGPTHSTGLKWLCCAVPCGAVRWLLWYSVRLVGRSVVFAHRDLTPPQVTSPFLGLVFSSWDPCSTQYSTTQHYTALRLYVRPPARRRVVRLSPGLLWLFLDVVVPSARPWEVILGTVLRIVLRYSTVVRRVVLSGLLKKVDAYSFTCLFGE